MCGRVEAAEHLRSALQVDLAEAERCREALWEKKTQLQAQLQKAEETGAELQAELKSVREEKEELKEKLSEVRGQRVVRVLSIPAHLVQTSTVSGYNTCLLSLKASLYCLLVYFHLLRQSLTL